MMNESKLNSHDKNELQPSTYLQVSKILNYQYKWDIKDQHITHIIRETSKTSIDGPNLCNLKGWMGWIHLVGFKLSLSLKG